MKGLLGEFDERGRGGGLRRSEIGLKHVTNHANHENTSFLTFEKRIDHPRLQHRKEHQYVFLFGMKGSINCREKWSHIPH